MEKYSSDEELVVNGNFDATDFKGWTATGADGGVSPYINNGIAILPNLTSISQTINITGGKTYSLSYDMGILYQGTGYISVVSNPSNTPLFNDTSAGDQTAIALTVSNTSDTSLTITFDCTRGGEVDVDNVSLLESENAFVIGGDFSDPSLPGWVKYGTSAMPYVADEHLKIPAGAYATQDIILDEVTNLTLNYIMTIPEGTAGSFTVSSLPSSTEIYTNSTGSAGENITLTLAENDTGIRLKFSCKSGAEVDVDNVTVKHKSLVQDVSLTEVKNADGNFPGFDINSIANIDFALDTYDLPDGIGATIAFTAPIGSVIQDVAFPEISPADSWVLQIDSNGLSATATLTEDNVLWGSTFTLSLLFASDVATFTENATGEVSYSNSDGDTLNSTAITLTVTTTNPWDNVRDVSNCIIAMGADDGDYQTSGTLYVNGTDTPDGKFNAHAIPILVGVTFQLNSVDFPGPSKDDVQKAFSLVNNLGADVSASITNASDLSYLLPYDSTITSAPNKPKSGAFQVELDPFGVWCPKYHGDTLPAPVDLCIKLSAERTGGTYTFISNDELNKKLSINFIAQKKYLYSDTAGSSNYILTNVHDVGDEFTMKISGEVNDYGDTVYGKVFQVLIDSTPERSKYTYKFIKQVNMAFDKIAVDSPYYDWGTEIDSTYIAGMAMKGWAMWTNYSQFVLLPSCSATGQIDISVDRKSPSGNIGFVGTHERYGWATSGNVESTYTVPANNIAFYSITQTYKNSSTGVTFKGNNELNNGYSRIHLIDNFGNHVYMQPTFTVQDQGNDISITMEINDQ